VSKVDRLICHVLPKAFLMALVAEGRLVELQIVRRDSPSRVESVFLGRLERVMPDLDAASSISASAARASCAPRIAPAATTGRPWGRRSWSRCATTATARRGRGCR
jgi:hypothetical protein